jgi:hypothetical protein
MIKIRYFCYSVVDLLLIKHALQLLSIYSRIAMGYAFTVRDFADRSSRSTATWRDSPSVCALADDQRHLGHIVRAGDCWLAFDATRFNKTGTGFWLLGSCVNIATAKCAVELAVAENPASFRIEGSRNESNQPPEWAAIARPI